LKFILVFGLGFLLPVFLVGLNVAHILPGRLMLRAWRGAVFLCFLFTAVMTPDPNPWTMVILAVPLVGLYFAAVGVALLLDRRRAKSDVAHDWLNVADDEASAL
jgi:sec-independent protein translocase protein TatC